MTYPKAQDRKSESFSLSMEIASAHCRYCPQANREKCSQDIEDMAIEINEAIIDAKEDGKLAVIAEMERMLKLVKKSKLDPLIIDLFESFVKELKSKFLHL